MASPRVDLNADYTIPKGTVNDLRARFLVDEKPIGKGAFGEVFKCREKEGEKRTAAIKCILKNKITDANALKQLTRELSIHSQLDHPNIVKFYEALDAPEAVYIVMEYVSGGDLFKRVTQSPLKRLEEGEARRYFQQLMEAMKFMHANGIAHRDIKLENMLLGDGDLIKIADFGFAKALSQGSLVTSVGTPEYVAPEIIETLSSANAAHPTLSYDLGCDLWSCGVVLYAMLAGHYPFKDKNVGRMYELILKQRYVMSRNCSEGSARIIKNLLVTPEQRWGMEKIFADEWFQAGYAPARAGVVMPVGGASKAMAQAAAAAK